MTSILIIIFLAIGVYSGARRGLIVQSVHLVGYILTWIAASVFYKSLAGILEMVIPYPSDTTSSQLSLYNLLNDVEFDKTFYNGIAYVIILIIGWVITRLVALSLNRLGKLPVVHQVNWIGGAALGFICNWVGLFFLLTLLSLVPIASIQNIFAGNSLASFIVSHTPIISDQIIKAWMTHVR